MEPRYILSLNFVRNGMFSSAVELPIAHPEMRTAERSGCCVMEAAFWYNKAPKNGTDGQTVPSSMVHSYEWRRSMLRHEIKVKEAVGDWQVGDRVRVKPGNALCNSRWRIGRDTKLFRLITSRWMEYLGM